MTHKIPVVFVWLTFWLLPVSGLAKPPAFECGGELAGTEHLLSEVQGKYNEISSLNANFIQESYLAALESREVSSGEMWFLKPSRMKWRYTAPQEQLLLLRDKTMWFYQKEENQLMIDDISKVFLSDLPVSFILGVGDLTRDFNIKNVCRNETGTVLTLKPKSANDQSELKEFILLIDKDALPQGALVYDVAGNYTAILLKKRKINARVNEEMFNAEFPKDADVHDRRME